MGNPFDEDNETPEWEQKDEEIPPSLEKKWQNEEKIGLKAGVCSNCGWTFSREDISCIHCGERTNMASGFMINLGKFLLSSGFGIAMVVIILLSLGFYLIRS